jgi:SAM-dependent methyltransferase
MNSARQAFDRQAPIYDHIFASAKMRSEVWQIADEVFLPGMHVLDLGCGTGEDALHFARRGVRITAIDVSPEMISQTKRKAGGLVHCETADMETYSCAGSKWDGVFSNFGALNCIPQLDWIRRLGFVPGAHLVFTVMGRLYPLETAISLLKGKPRTAFRRLGKPCEGIVEGVRFNVYYHSLRTIQTALGQSFELRCVQGLRSLMPAPHLEHLHRFAAVRLLEPIDRWLCAHRLTAVCADHFVSVWRYRET